MDETAPVRRTRLTAGQRQESILEAATQVFAAAGYRTGKVSDVAARIGVTEPVIFQNFGSKAALYAAVLDRMADRIRAELRAAAGRHPSVSELLAHLLNPPAGAVPPHRLLFADAAALVADPDPDLAEPARRAARSLADHLTDLIRRGQATGEIRGGMDPATAAWLLLSIMSARPLRAAMPDRDRTEAGIGEIVLRALTAPAPPEPQ